MTVQRSAVIAFLSVEDRHPSDTAYTVVFEGVYAPRVYGFDHVRIEKQRKRTVFLNEDALDLDFKRDFHPVFVRSVLRNRGTVDSSGKATIKEYKGGSPTGYYFEGYLNSSSFSGKYKTTSRPLVMNFYASER